MLCCHTINFNFIAQSVVFALSNCQFQHLKLEIGYMQEHLHSFELLFIFVYIIYGFLK